MLSKSIKKIIPFRPFYRAIDETLKIPEKCWPLLYLNFTKVDNFTNADNCTGTVNVQGDASGRSKLIVQTLACFRGQHFSCLDGI